MTTPQSAKEAYLGALETRREINKWLALPRCATCLRYAVEDNSCIKFGPMPPDSAFVIHADPCPDYCDEQIPF